MTDKIDYHALLFTSLDSLDIPARRALGFNIDEPIKLTLGHFKEFWPLVQNFWTSNGSWKSGCSKSQVFFCHLKKHKLSSTRKEGVPLQKRRKASIREPNLCDSQIKVVHFEKNGFVVLHAHPNPKACTTHRHAMDMNDQIKIPAVIRQLVRGEAQKPYRPYNILTAVREMATNVEMKGLTDYLSTKFIANIQYKEWSIDLTRRTGAKDMDSDMQNAMNFLKENGYHVAQFAAGVGGNEGFFFATAYQKECLEKNGWLTMLDSTHGTNRYGWKLFTFYL